MAGPQTRSTLESYFQTGDVPTQEQFYELIASYVHKLDDGVTVYIDSGNPAIKRFGIGVQVPESRLGVMQDNSNDGFISFHSQPSPAAADWTINSAGGTGFRISEAGALHRFFIKESNGYIGVGTSTPQQLLDLAGSASNALLGIKTQNQAALANQGWIMGHEDGDSGIGIDQDGYFLIREITNTGTPPANIKTRLSIRPADATQGNRMGINTDEPFTTLHVWANASSAHTKIGLSSSAGVQVIGQVEGYNLVFDHQGIQSRYTVTAGTVLTPQVSTLNLQPLGGDIKIHNDETDVKKKAVLLANGFFGLGTIAPFERVDVNGAIKIGDSEAVTPNPGTIRYRETSPDVFDFQGYVEDSAGAGSWQSLTGGGGGGGSWEAIAGGINYGGSGNVGINDTTPQQKLDVNGAIKIGDSTSAIPGSIRFRNDTGFEGADATGVWKAMSSQWTNVSGGINYATGNIGIGITSPTESIHSNGAILLGSSLGNNAGTLRYFSGQFQGAVSTGVWRSLTSQWLDGAGNINYQAGQVGIGTNSPSAALHIFDNKPAPAAGGARTLYVQNQMHGGGFTGNRIGIDICNSGDYDSTPSNYDIGLMVSCAFGHTTTNRNLAAAFNGNIAISELNTSNVVGTNGRYVFSLQDSNSTTGGEAYPTASPDTSIVQIFSKRNSAGGYSAFTVMNGNGEVINLFKATKIADYIDYTAGSDYNTDVANLINRMNARILQLEQRLQNFGLLL